MRLQQLHQPLLVHGAGAGNHLQVGDTLEQLLVGEVGKLGTGDDVAVAILGLPQRNLAGYLACRSRGVARYNLHLDAGIQALGHSLGHLFAHRVGNSGHTQEGEADMR